MSLSELTASIVLEYQSRVEHKGTIGAYKALGRELRDKFNLTDREALDLLANENVIEIISKYEQEELSCQKQQ